MTTDKLNFYLDIMTKKLSKSSYKSIRYLESVSYSEVFLLLSDENFPVLNVLNLEVSIKQGRSRNIPRRGYIIGMFFNFKGGRTHYLPLP